MERLKDILACGALSASFMAMALTAIAVLGDTLFAVLVTCAWYGIFMWASWYAIENERKK